jgi:hypothetical protein
LTHPVLEKFSEMLEDSQLESVIIHHSYKTLSLQRDDWTMLGSAFQKRGIKTFNFGCLDLSNDNLSYLFEGLCIAGTETLTMQNNYLKQLSPGLWIKFTDSMKNVPILTLDIRQDDSITENSQSWQGFCHMIEKSGIRKLYCDINNYHSLTREQVTLFCNAIRHSRLETLVLDYNWSLSIMEIGNFKMLFNAINRSSIICLPNLSEFSFTQAGINDVITTHLPEKKQIISNTLRIINNRSKCKGLLGLCVATLFNRYNAQLTDTKLVLFKDEDPIFEADLLNTEIDVLKQFI